jgi:hypothetical protein
MDAGAGHLPFFRQMLGQVNELLSVESLSTLNNLLL